MNKLFWLSSISAVVSICLAVISVLLVDSGAVDTPPRHISSINFINSKMCRWYTPKTNYYRLIVLESTNDDVVYTPGLSRRYLSRWNVPIGNEYVVSNKEPWPSWADKNSIPEFENTSRRATSGEIAEFGWPVPFLSRTVTRFDFQPPQYSSTLFVFKSNNGKVLAVPCKFSVKRFSLNFLVFLCILLFFRYAYVKIVLRTRRRKQLCPRCRYSVSGQVNPVCPECGTHLFV